MTHMRSIGKARLTVDTATRKMKSGKQNLQSFAHSGNVTKGISKLSHQNNHRVLTPVFDVTIYLIYRDIIVGEFQEWLRNLVI
jgi:hypothetical protein